jgi:hypothetical protein
VLVLRSRRSPKRSSPDEYSRGTKSRPWFGPGHGKRAPRSPLDMTIAAVAEANDCVSITENDEDFVGLRVFNPLSAD